MVERGLLEETADLLSMAILNPSSPPGRAIGYRQAIEYLLQSNVNTNQEEETAFKVNNKGLEDVQAKIMDM